MGTDTAKSPKPPPRDPTPEAQRLTRLLQEATRATPVSGPETYVPPSGGDRAGLFIITHLREMEGKSSLLRHLQHQMMDANRVAVWIDQEIYSRLSYPDVLVSALYELMKSLATTLERKIALEPQPQRRFATFGRKQADTPQTQLLAELRTAATELEKLKFAPLNRKIEWKIVEESDQNSKTTAGVRMQLVSLQADVGSAERTATTTSEIVDGTKEGKYSEITWRGGRPVVSAVVGRHAVRGA